MMSFLGLPNLLWAGVCLIVAGVFVIVWPKKKVTSEISPVRYVVLRWFHSLAWFLLALWLTLIELTGSGLANLVGFLALPVYLAFMIALFVK
jgi:hypothetical protein